MSAAADPVDDQGAGSVEIRESTPSTIGCDTMSVSVTRDEWRSHGSADESIQRWGEGGHGIPDQPQEFPMTAAWGRCSHARRRPEQVAVRLSRIPARTRRVTVSMTT